MILPTYTPPCKVSLSWLCHFRGLASTDGGSDSVICGPSCVEGLSGARFEDDVFDYQSTGIDPLALNLLDPRE